MTSVSLEIDIPVAPARVYDLLVDPTHYAEWQPLHESWPQGPPEIAEGRSFVQRTRFMGRSNDITWTVVESRAPSALVLDGEGPMGMTMHCAYRLSGDRTHTTLHVDSGLDGAPLAMRGMVARGGRVMAAASLADLTALLIGDEPAPEKGRSRLGSLADTAGAAAKAVGRVVPGSIRRVIAAPFTRRHH
jgi:hypothetical protein